MKKDKNALYFNKILNCLLDGETYTILQIAANVGLSEKTVRTKIDQMNRWLTAHDMGRIKKKQGTGIWLETDARQQEDLKKHLAQGRDLNPAVQPDDRRKQVIGKLLRLMSGETTTLQQLGESLYLSAPTVGGLLREVSPWFEERSLKVASIRSKGVCLVGDEYNFRIAIKDYIIELMPEVMEAILGAYAPGVDISRIRRIVIEAENAWRIELADNSFKMVWIMACLSMARRHLGDKAVFSTREENIEHYNEYSFAESIYQRIEQAYQIKISDGDTVLLAVLLLSAKKLKNFSSIQDTNYARQYDKDLGKFVKLVIETIVRPLGCMP